MVIKTGVASLLLLGALRMYPSVRTSIIWIGKNICVRASQKSGRMGNYYYLLCLHKNVHKVSYYGTIYVSVYTWLNAH